MAKARPAEGALVEDADWPMAVVGSVGLKVAPALVASVLAKEEVRGLAKEVRGLKIQKTQPWLVVAVAVADVGPN